MLWSKCETAILAGLLAAAIVGTAWAQNATGGADGTVSGSGDYGISGSFGGQSAGVDVSGVGSTSGLGLGGASQGNGQVGISGGVGNSTAGAGGYAVTGPTGLPQISGTPSIDAGGAVTGSASGLALGGASK
jgi:hypothetical protein